MKYDLIKNRLGNLIRKSVVLRILFYKLLDLLLLRAWYIKREIKKSLSELGPDAIVLDAGSGFGQYSYFLSGISEGWKIKAIDIKSEQTDDCNHFFSKIGKDRQVLFETADLTQFVEKEHYDLILCVDVMEHIPDDVLVLRNFALSTRENGILLISTPSDLGGSDVHDEQDNSFIEEHVRNGYNINDIRDKIRLAGYSDVTAKYSYGWPGKLSWNISMKFPIILVTTSKLFFILLPVYYVVMYPLAFILNLFDINLKHQAGTGLIVKAVK